MTTTFQPTWLDNLSLVAPSSLLYGGTNRATLDLRAYRGAWLKLAVGMYATGNLNAGADVIVRRALNNDATASHAYCAPYAQFLTRTNYGYQKINYASGYAAGVQSIAFSGQAGTAFAHGDFLCITGQTSIPSGSGALTLTNTGFEIVRCSAGTSTPLLPDSVTKYPHLNAEYITCADAWGLWLPGGSTYVVLLDTGAVTTSSAVFFYQADYQLYEYESQVSV
jgi:hypothetical protein